jgi:tetratricopeptide (TPR) repeat protein
MLRWSLILSFAVLQSALAQELPELKLPRTSSGDSTRIANVAKDPVSSYSSRHEAALAALQAGIKAATVERNRARAMRFLLVSLRRDPYVAKTLYDMGVLCAQDERWQDALSFYRAAQQTNPEPHLAQLSAADIERVQAVEHLESTPEGKKRREFDITFLAIIKMASDPLAALIRARDLANKDKTRWEPHVFVGLMHAKTGAFLESVKDLEEAARLAPPIQRQKLQTATDVARREANFAEQRKSADELWGNRQYNLAAKLYAKAFEDSPGHLDVAMEAATGYLLDDQVPQAILLLAQLRDTRSDDLSAKAVAMLRELGSISEDAQKEAAKVPKPPLAREQPEDAAERIASLVGQLTSPQMELTAKPNPILIPDNTPIIPVPDEELTAGHNDAGLLTTESVFALYQRDLPAGEAPPPVESKPAPNAEAAPAPSPRAAATPDRPTLPGAPAPAGPLGDPSRVEPRVEKAEGHVVDKRPVLISSIPPGATLMVNEETTSLRCTAPCPMLLPLGRHTLRATLPKYREAQKIFNVEEKNAPVEVTLEEKRGTLLVKSQTPGADVLLNGKKTGKQTPAVIGLPEGDYDVDIEVAGDIVKGEKVTVEDGRTYQLAFPK